MGINVDANLSHDIITEKPGSIQTVLYKIYVILSGADGFDKHDAIDFCNADHSQLNTLQNLAYKHRLRQLIPRQSDVSLAQILSRFEKQRQINEKKIKKADLMDILKKEALVQKHRKSRLQRSYNLRIMQSELMAKLEATIINLPGHIGKKLKNRSLNEEQLKQTYTNSIILKELDEFDSREENYDLYNSNTFKARAKSGEQANSNITVNTLKDYFNEATMNYMEQIHKKANEEKKAISERQKRRRRVIMDILEAHHNRQEEIRSKQIMQRFSRQSHLESRICVQLEQIQREKSIILENRREREKQYEARRELEFQLAMDREREMLLQKKEEEQERFAELKQFWSEQLAKRRQASYKRHYDFIQNDIIPLLLQFVMNVADYRVYTRKLIPLRLFRQWKIEFVKGILLSDTSSAEIQIEDHVEDEIKNTAYQLQLKPDQIIEEQQELLDECDLEEYQNLTGDWDLAKVGALYMKSLPNELIPHIQGKPIEWIDFKDEIQSNEFKLPNDINQLRNNPILEWIIKRLYKINFPANPEPTKSDLPEFPIKIALLGKPLSGKTTIINELEKNNQCIGIHPYQLIEEAIKAYENKEIEECSNLLIDNSNLDEMETLPTTTVSVKAKLGEILWNDLKVGKNISDDLLVDLVYEKIKTLHPTVGFILDGFPTNYNQAKLLEQKLAGNRILVTDNTSNNALSSINVTNSKMKNGLDLIIILDISDEIILKRVAHSTLFKLELNDSLVKYTTVEQIPFNSQVGIHSNKSSDQISTTNISNNLQVQENQNFTYTDNLNYSSFSLHETQGNIPERLINYIQSWPKLYKFYNENKLSKLCTVNLTDLLQSSTFNYDDVENNNESMKLAVYLEIEKRIEEFLKLKENEPLIKTLSPEVMQYIGNDAAVLINSDKNPTKVTDDNGGSEKVEESRRTLFASSTIDPTNNDELNDIHKKLDSNNGIIKENIVKTKNGNTSLPHPTERPVTAKSPSSGKRSKSPSAGQSTKPNDNKDTRSIRVTETNLPNHEKKLSKKSKLKSMDSPQLPELGGQEQTDTPQVKLPQPGDENYQFVELPVMQESAHILWKLWENTETLYNQNLKSTFRQIRLLNLDIIPHMYHIKQQFYNYLYRPDSKQHFLSQFISAFNSLMNEMRSDKETKADLHCRTDDLRDTLYEIIDETKQANEKRLDILLDMPGWFTDKQRLLINSYLSLLQIELTRFQETAQLIKDYYNVMEAKPQIVENELIQALSGTIDAGHMEYSRIPLVKIPDDNIENNDSSGSRKSTSTRQNSSKSSSTKGNKSKLIDSNNDVLSKYPTSVDMKFENLPVEFRSQINLLNYNSSLQEIFTAFTKNGLPPITQTTTTTQQSQKGDKKPAPGKANPTHEKLTLTNPLNLLLDKPTQSTNSLVQFLYNACLSVMQIILNQVQSVRSSRASEAILDGYTMEPVVRAVDPKGGKSSSADKTKGGQPRKGQKKSIVPKEKGSKPDEQLISPEITDEDQKARETRQHIREEHIAALEKEAAKTVFRFTLIRAQGSAVLSDLQEKTSQLKQFMTDCIGIKTLKEHDAVNDALEVIRYMIEKEQKLPEKMILDGEQFYIDESCITPSISNDSILIEKLRIHPPIVNKLTESEPQYFDLMRLKYLCDTFSALNDTGFIDVINFKTLLKPFLIERFTELTGSCSGDTLNELLTCLVYKYRLLFETDAMRSSMLLLNATTTMNNTNNDDLLKVNNTYDKQRVYYIDWRQFLLAACQPAITYHHSTLITQSTLVELSQRLIELDQSAKHENLLNVKVTRAQFQFAAFKWFPVGVKYYEELHDFVFSIFTKKVTQSKIYESNSKTSPQNIETNIISQNDQKTTLEETIDCSDLLLNMSVIQVKTPYIGFLRCLSTLLGRHVPYISVQNQLTVDHSDMEYEGVPQNCVDDPIPEEILEKALSFGLINTSQSRNDDYDLNVSQVLDASEPGSSLISDKLHDIFSNLKSTGQSLTLNNLLHNINFQNLLINSLSQFKEIAQFSEPWITALQTYANNHLCHL
ncbi:Sperm flagellar protein [Schistosoma japonicum]|uniref:Sperm flagellar protein n=1 Tax=Schistosoma japonicum TaxID=6182 RepID=A0A4Z2CYW7_SCHJA|nr:Sperm flagellar protein [Schistosoma japonicum]